MVSRTRVTLTAVVMVCLVGLSEAKPRITLASDGFPTGQDTPEGAAADLARAFINADANSFRQICIRPYNAGQPRADYIGYLNGVLDHFKQRTRIAPDDPEKIVRVFLARHLSKSGPASYGYASFDFQDVMFVDVEVASRSGSKHVRRTMVIKDRDGLWYVHPVPDVSPLLSFGLYDESPSAQVFSDFYETGR